jgi:hypothetical protein
LIKENSFSCNRFTLAYSRLTTNLPDFGLTEKYCTSSDFYYLQSLRLQFGH